MRVLVADDDSVSRRILESTLNRWDYEPIVVSDGMAAWEILQAPNPPHLVILDWNMPGMDGVDVCRQMRAREDSEYAYTILLTARGDKASMIEGMEAGADDYLVKPFDVDDLKIRLKVADGILELQKHLILARESLREQAMRDELTGMWNRRAIHGILTRELERAHRDRRAVAVIMCDVDHFKHVNDTHGHAVGDAVLKEVAKRLCSVARPYDMVGRYGGEEFIAVFPGCEGTFAGYVADRVRMAVNQKAIEVGDLRLDMTISLGVAAAMAPEPSLADRLIDLADGAMYDAKEAGRDCVRVANISELNELLQQK